MQPYIIHGHGSMPVLNHYASDRSHMLTAIRGVNGIVLGKLGLDHTDAASFSSSSRPVASRYSCTQRSITAEVFSTLVN